MPQVISVYNKLAKFRIGKWLFSQIICWKAPYFKTIHPVFVDLKPGYCEIKIRKRRSVENHLRTVHAIAMANMCELAAGLLTEVSIPSHMRWIPVGMQINYLRKAKTNLRAIAKIDLPDWKDQQDIIVPLRVLDSHDKEVVSAAITMRVSSRR